MKRNIRLLPLMILVSALTFTVRLGDFIAGLSHVGTAYAQQEVSASPPPMPGKDAANPAAKPAPAKAAATDTKTDAKTAAPAATDTKVAAPAAGDKKPADWKDAGDVALDDSDVKNDLYKDLAARRATLEKREKELNVREALLKAGEQKVDQKLQQLTSVRNEIQGLLKQQNDEQKARIDSLVKIYEGMKAEDAARIFNTLDMDVVMKVMGNMSERKSGPILAAMTPDRARQVTQLLAQQKQLPEMPPQ